MLLLVRRHRNDSAEELWGYVTKRAKSLYLLFLSWNCIYAAVRFAEHCFIRDGRSVRWSLEAFFLGGFAEQLWFLSFIAVVTVLVAGPGFFLARMGSEGRSFALLMAMFGVVLAILPSPIGPTNFSHAASYWFNLLWQTLPSAFMVFAIIPFLDFCAVSRPRPLIALSLVFTAAFLLWLSKDGQYPNILRNAAGVLMLLAALLGSYFKGAAHMAKSLGALALPVYLLHVLFVHGIQAVGHRIAHLPVSEGFDGFVLVGALFGSCVFAWFLRKIPCIRWLFMSR